MNRDNLIEYIKYKLEENNKEADFFSVGYPCYDHNEIINCIDTLLELRLSQGKYVKKFENEFINYLNSPEGSYGCACNSGSSANLLLFSTLIAAGDIKRGDKIIVPASTFATVASPLYQLGLVPVYVDCDLETHCMSSKHIEEATKEYSDIKVCMVVHNLGFSSNMNKLKDLCNKENIMLVEDCCEAHGGLYDNKKLGTFGDYSTWSFFVAHNITTGEGGLVVSNNGKHESLMRSIREFGRRTNAKQRYEGQSTDSLGIYDTRYIFDRLGYNIRMTDYAASMGSIQLSKLDSLNNQRRVNAERLNSIFNKHKEVLSYLKPEKSLTPAYYGYPVYVKEGSNIGRNSLCKNLEDNQIETRPNMGGCLPCQPGFKNLEHKIIGNLANSTIVMKSSFFIGVHSGLKDRHFEILENTLDSYLN